MKQRWDMERISQRRSQGCGDATSESNGKSTGGCEPTWMGDGVAIRLAWDTAGAPHLETFNCASDGTCTDAPSAYGFYYFRDGHWVATYEPFLQDGTCQRDLNVLALSSDDVLRITHNENRINMPCGPIPDSAFACSNEWLQEFRRRAE